MIKRIILKGIILLIIIFVVVTIIGLLTPSVSRWWKSYQYNLRVEELKSAALARERAYASDRDGGKTPEETFDLFLSALKEGNTLKASRYYELSVQPKALLGLQEELTKNGSLSLSIKYFTEVRTKGTKGCNEEGDGCTFEYRGIDGYNRFFDIGLNNSSGIWKMEKPY